VSFEIPIGWSVLFGYEISMAVVFFITRFQKQSVLFRYEFSVAVGFGGSRNLSDGRFWRVMKLQ